MKDYIHSYEKQAADLMKAYVVLARACGKTQYLMIDAAEACAAKIGISVTEAESIYREYDCGKA